MKFGDNLSQNATLRSYFIKIFNSVSRQCATSSSKKIVFVIEVEIGQVTFETLLTEPVGSSHKFQFIRSVFMMRFPFYLENESQANSNA